jgi:hypothetical protein
MPSNRPISGTLLHIFGSRFGDYIWLCCLAGYSLVRFCLRLITPTLLCALQYLYCLSIRKSGVLTSQTHCIHNTIVYSRKLKIMDVLMVIHYLFLHPSVIQPHSMCTSVLNPHETMTTIFFYTFALMPA